MCSETVGYFPMNINNNMIDNNNINNNTIDNNINNNMIDNNTIDNNINNNIIDNNTIDNNINNTIDNNINNTIDNNINNTIDNYNIDNNYNYNIDNKLSIYIPHVSENQANQVYFINIFDKLNIGMVKRVDFQTYQNTTDKMAFVHMNKWYDNIAVEHLQEKIIDKNHEAKIVYDDPNYWIIRQNNRPIPDNYAQELEKLHLLVFETNKSMTQKIHTLEQKNVDLENTLKEMKWWINLHDVNISYIIDQNNSKLPDDSIEKKTAQMADCLNTTTQTQETNSTIYTNNSCCGAVSDAWNPAGEYKISELNNKNWSRRLRPRR